MMATFVGHHRWCGKQLGEEERAAGGDASRSPGLRRGRCGRDRLSRGALAPPCAPQVTAPVSAPCACDTRRSVLTALPQQATVNACQPLCLLLPPCGRTYTCPSFMAG